MRRVLVCLLLALLASGLMPPGAESPSLARAATPQVLVVGDSLAVGMKPYLGTLLAPRRLTWSAKSGITTPQGMQRLRTALRTVRPKTVVISLGTNDGPDPRRFADRLARTLAAIPADACIVWTALHRAPRKGAYRPMNDVLRSVAREDPRLVVVSWDRMVARGTVSLPDGVHPDTDGFATRSQVIASAVRERCAGA